MLVSYNMNYNSLKQENTHVNVQASSSQFPVHRIFPVKDDDGCMPGSDASARLHDYETAITRSPYAVNLPSNKLRGHGSDHAIAEVVNV